MKKIPLLFILLTLISFSFSQNAKLNQVAKVETTKPKDQARAGTCWSFATVSFIETEVLRNTGKEFDLSENFTVYYAYINKAIIYVRKQGKHNFAQGGQAHDVFDVIKKYGIVPDEAYPYKNKNHTKLETDLKYFLDSIVKLDTLPRFWLDDYKKILDNSLGVPPTNFEYEGQKYTPKTFLLDVLKFNTDDYIEITSFSHQEFNTQFVLEVADNWSLDLYYNVTISDLMAIIDNALKNNYSVAWDGDVSETGFNTETGFADLKGENGQKIKVMVPQALRQMMFDQLQTTDDHLMHCIGLFTDEKEQKYYLIKNSWGSYPPFDGYLYMSEDFVMYKTIAIMVHKQAIPQKIKEKLGL